MDQTLYEMQARLKRLYDLQESDEHETHAMCVLEAYLCDRLGNDWITKLDPERLIEEYLEIAHRNVTAFIENVNRAQSVRNN